MPITKNSSNTLTGKDSLPANKQKGKKVCTCCHENKNMTAFYLSYSPMYSLDQRVPICKECCKKYALNSDGTIDYSKLKELLMHIDKPLYYDQLSSAESSVKKENSYLSDEEVSLHGYDILSKYFTLIAMRQDRSKSYNDSKNENYIHSHANTSKKELDSIQKKYTILFNNSSVTDNSHIILRRHDASDDKETSIIKYDDNDFEVTDDMIRLFGEGYTKSEYRKMFNKYEKLKLNYTLQTNLHQEALATYVRFKVKEEDATAKGDVTEAKKWYDAAQSAAENGKLTPKQLTKADLDSGVNSVSELTKALEQAVDVIKILPKFKYRPNDAVDFTIYCYIDYERKLNDQPSVPYEEVYAFYDKKKQEYIEQNGDPYGIFSNDPTEKNRETVKTFIKLPDNYDDLAGDSNDD